MRAFIAVEISEGARAEVARLQETLRTAGADVKWVEPENLHLTLKFLDEIDEMQAARLEKTLQSAVSSFRSFSFRLEGVEVFPRMSNPKVLWVGVREGKPPLAELTVAVGKTCEGLGFPVEERTFSPHLTIGRVRSSKGLPRLVKMLEGAEFLASVPCPAEKIVLFQSILSSRGPCYQALCEIPLEQPS